MLVIGEPQLNRVLKEYVNYCNRARPHQGIGQRIPAPTVSPPGEARAGGVMAFPVLNTPHHNYLRAAV
jgi:putative transposase